MKKRLFNSKRKLLTVIAIILFVAYLGCSFVVVSIASNAVDDEMRDTIHLPISEAYYVEDIYNGKWHTTENFIPQEFGDYGSLPSAVALYDENGNLVHRSGALISFFDDDLGFGGSRYCYIEEYLTDEQLNDLLDFAEENEPINVKEFRYYQPKESTIVPVSFVVENMNKEKGSKELEIVIDANYSGDVRVQDQDDKYLWLSLYEGNFTGHKNYYKKSQIKKYREAIELVTSEKYRNEAYEEFQKGTGGGWVINSFYTQDININGKPHFVVVCVRYDNLVHILHKSQYDLEFLFFFFCILTAVVLSVASKYYDKTKAFEESKNAFISAMTHEMKTPVAIIQNQCECILENIAPEKNEEYLKSIYDETQKMDKLVTDMLQYNRIATNGKVNVEKCNLSDIVKEETEKYKKQFELHEKNVTLKLKETAIVKCDKNLIALVVDNMLSNTIKHTENGGEVIVTVKDGVEGYKVTVYNSGSTVPENEKDKIWSVLYKTDKSRTERDKSSGVGLAVSAKILDLHKAQYGCLNVNDGVEFYFNIK